MEPVSAVAIGAGLLGATAIGLRLRAVAKQKAALSPAQQTAVAQPLPPAAAAIVNGPGAQPSQAAINSLKIEIANGNADLDNMLKAANGTLFNKVSPPGPAIPDSIATQIIKTDQVTFDVASAGLNIPAIPSGNMLAEAQGPANMTERSLEVKSIDPRAQSATVFRIPIGAITGISPAGT